MLAKKTRCKASPSCSGGKAKRAAANGPQQHSGATDHAITVDHPKRRRVQSLTASDSMTIAQVMNT